LRSLRDIASLINKRHGIGYQPVLIEGNDISGIDVGYLIKNPVKIKSVSPLFSNKTYGKKQKQLFARPPLLIEVCVPECIKIVNLHLRSMRGLRSAEDGQRVALKRRLQAEALARWTDTIQREQPRSKLIIAGDFNALTPSDKFVDSVGIIMGKPDMRRPRWKSRDLVATDLIDITREVKANRRYSYIYKRKKQQLDYILVSKTLIESLKSVSFSRIDYTVSDHAAVFARFAFNP